MRFLGAIFPILMLAALIVAVLILYPPLRSWLYLSPEPPLTHHLLPLPPVTGTVDRIVVEKSRRMMWLMQGDRAVRVYRIALGFSPEGDKERQGDGRTPEGIFRIDRRNENSSFHLSLGIDYPQASDRARASEAGYDPGGDIMIHGQPNGFGGLSVIRRDWTAGCIALSDAEIREVWRVTPVGTEVEILP